MKACPTCGQYKKSEDFNGDRSTDDRLSRNCKVCNRKRRKEYYWSHRDQELFNDKRDRANDHDHVREREKKYVHSEKGKSATRHYWHIRQLRKGIKIKLKIPCDKCIKL